MRGEGYKQGLKIYHGMLHAASLVQQSGFRMNMSSSSISGHDKHDAGSTSEDIRIFRGSSRALFRDRLSTAGARVPERRHVIRSV